MPVSGLVLTLARPGPEAECAVDWMRSDTRFELGEPDPDTPRRLPVTLDTADRAEDKRLWQQMQDHPGIAFVDVACVFFEDAPGTAPDGSVGVESPVQTTAHEPTQARSRPW